jgi:branched-chain amino acid transport system substrate-binding protein
LDVQQGIEIAIDDKGGKLLGRDIRLTVEDALCSPEGGTSAATKVAADTTVAGVIGAVCTDEVRGGIQTITDAGLTTVSASASRANLTAPTRGPEFAGFLRTAQSDLLQGTMVAEYLYNELGKRTLATIHDGSGYAQGIVEVAVERFKGLGGTVTKQEAVSVGQTDMSTVLTSVAADNPDVLYYPIFMPEGGFLTTQSKTTPGLENTILFSSDGLFTPDFVSAVGEDALDMYLSSPDTTKFAAGYQDFLTKRAAKFGGDTLGPYHAHAYDATNMVMAAIEKVAVTDAADGTIYIGRKALRDALYATQGFRGLTGVLTCGQYGDCGSPILAVYQVTAREVGGEWPPATVFEQAP